MRTSARRRRGATLAIRAVGARASRRRHNHCQTDHENFCHFSLSSKTTHSCHLFNTAPSDSARPFSSGRRSCDAAKTKPRGRSDPPRGLNDYACSRLLGQPQGIQRLLINRRRYRQTTIDLISLNCAASPWTQDSIDRSIIVPLLCQGSLHLRGHVAGHSVAITEDRAVVNIVAVVGIIPVGGIPPAAIPIPVTATVPDEA